MGLSIYLNNQYGFNMSTNYPIESASCSLTSMLYRLALVTLLLGLAACSNVPTKEVELSVENEGPEQATEEDIVRIEPVRPKIPLSEEILYKTLVAEFAGQRDRLDIAVENYLDLARTTRDPKYVERATRIAIYARNTEAARETAALWVELDPTNPDAHQVLAVMSLRNGDIEKSLEHLETILEYSHGKLDQKLWMIANMLGREKDKALVMQVMEKLLLEHQQDPEALYAFAHVAARIGNLDRAEELLLATLELAPDNDNAAMSYISILQKQGRLNDALKWIETILPTREDNDFNLRSAYARLLTDAKRFDEARRQFEILAVQAPNNSDVLFALGLLYLQSNRLDEAKNYFKRLVVQDIRSDDANYYLGRIDEEHKNYEQAGVWYQSVQSGENYFDSQIRYGLILAKQGNMEAARAHLKKIPTRGEGQATLLVQAEGELLTEEKLYDEALAVYDTAIEGKKYNTELLYARAMLAEKMSRIDLMEQDLRRILVKEPDNVQALNALGYTLADETDRYQEAYALVKRALELSPDDFYILDSMGWVMYRLGRHEEAIALLQKAMSLRQDPEIAAHLGEVLWVKGDKEAAKKVWETALQATPEDSRLLDVIKRFDE
jgi:tetratricopeptide (TPR) repeat protein